MKNFKMNKKKVFSLLLAMGISLCSHSSISEGNYENNENTKVKVTGMKVNVRLSPTTNTKNNIIGMVNTGDTFTYLNYENGWYLVNYYGQEAYINDKYGVKIVINGNVDEIQNINVAKITGNNVNIRYSPNTNDNSNVIGFADITDSFRIIDKNNDWYLIDYLGQRGYVFSKYVKEVTMNEEDYQTQRMVFLKNDALFYSDTNGSYLTTLPANQYAAVIKEENGYYKVRIDGVIGYVKISDTKKLTNTFIVSDLGRQIVKVFKNNQEVYRAHMISGRESMQTDLGVFKIGHKLTGYQLTPTNYVEYWMQYNDNEGFHDASWQKDKYYAEVAKDAYDRFASGRSKTFPVSHGSHGCDNLKLNDAREIYNLINVGDNVLVIMSNDLVRQNLISDNLMESQKVKKLV